jgi:hypothetical protein
VDLLTQDVTSTPEMVLLHPAVEKVTKNTTLKGVDLLYTIELSQLSVVL